MIQAFTNIGSKLSNTSKKQPRSLSLESPPKNDRKSRNRKEVLSLQIPFMDLGSRNALNDSTRTTRLSEKSVSFAPMVRVRKIPNIDDITESGVLGDLYWTQQELDSFKQAAFFELADIKQLLSSLLSLDVASMGLRECLNLQLQYLDDTPSSSSSSSPHSDGERKETLLQLILLQSHEIIMQCMLKDNSVDKSLLLKLKSLLPAAAEEEDGEHSDETDLDLSSICGPESDDSCENF